MSRLGFAWLISLILAATAMPAALAQEGESESVGKKLAVVVGVEHYDRKDELGNLKFAIEDARELADVLKLRGFGRQDVRVLLGTRDAVEGVATRDRANRVQIEEALALAISRASRPEDTLILAFSGHGVELPDGAKTGVYRSYFCPTDADPRDPKTMIDLSGLYDRLKDCPAGMKLLLVDACQVRDPDAKGPSPMPSGASKIRKGAPVLSGASTTRSDFLTRPVNTVAIFGCEAGKQSFELSALNHGIFMHCVIKAFKFEAEDAIDKATRSVTILSLASYLTVEVRKLSKRFDKPEQLPTVSLQDTNATTPILRREAYQDKLAEIDKYQQQGKRFEAMDSASKAVELGPKVYLTWLRKAELGEMFRVGDSFLIEDATRAIELLEPISGTWPIEMATARLIRARARHRSGDGRWDGPCPDLNLALKDVDQCLAALDGDIKGREDEGLSLRREAYFLKAKVALDLEDVRLARESYSNYQKRKGLGLVAASADVTFDSLLLQCRIQVAEGRFADASKWSETLLKAAKKTSEPKRPTARTYFEQGQIHRGLNQLDEAVQSLKLAINEAPSFDQAKMFLADLLIERGQFIEARDIVFDEAFEAKQTAEVLIIQARVRIGLGQWPRAKDQLDHVAKWPGLTPRTRAKVWLARAELQEKSGDAEAAKESRQRGEELDPRPKPSNAR